LGWISFVGRYGHPTLIDLVVRQMYRLQRGKICGLFILVVVISVSGSACSRSTTSKQNAASTIQEQSGDARSIYNPASLVEVKSLAGFPEELQVALGARIKGYGRIADVGEECNPTDVVGDGPDRCFLLGGLGGRSALVAYKVGGYAGQREVAASYVRTNSGWVKIEEGNIGYPNNLSDLKEMSRLAAEDNPAKKK
jgi:hypothetical protein